MSARPAPPEQSAPLAAPAPVDTPRDDNAGRKAKRKESTEALLRRVRHDDEQRSKQLKSILEGGIRKGERAKAAKEAHHSKIAKALELSTFPVHLKVEHCAVQRDPGNVLRVGQVKKSVVVSNQSISTLHAPFSGTESLEGTSFKMLRSALRRIYDIALRESAHRGHEHPSQKDGDIIMGDVRFQLAPGDEERVLSEQSWNEAMALLVCQQQFLPQNGGIKRKERIATFVAGFTCPRGS